MRFRKFLEMRSYDHHNFKATIDGKEYRVEVDNVGDEDCDKMWHDVYLPDGKRTFVDWSPYLPFTESDLELWVQCGMPKREDLGLRGPIRTDDLVAYAKTKGVK